MYKCLISLIFLSQQAMAQNNIAATGSNIKTKDAEAILTQHNTVRKELGVDNLTWSISLAAYAQKWANYLAQQNGCNIKHREHSGQNGMVYGENIFWGSSVNDYPPVEASYSWYNEKKYYKYRKVSSSNWFKTGHYTQMIWKDTREIGVGIAVCPNGAVIVVANYYPAGNLIGKFPY